MDYIAAEAPDGATGLHKFDDAFQSNRPFAILAMFRVIILILAFVPLWPFALSGQVQLGSEALAATGFKELQGKRVGLITNP